MMDNGPFVTDALPPAPPGSLWRIVVVTRRPLLHLPRMVHLASERRDASHGYRYEGRFRQAETHFLFKYTIAGEGRFRDAAGEHAVPPGHGFLCEISDPATAYYYPADGREPWEFVYCCFKWPAGRATVREFIDRYGAVHALPVSSGVIARLLAWRHYRHRWLELDPGASAAPILELMTALVSAQESARSEDSTDQLVQRAQGLIRDRLSESLTVATLAGILEVSREHLSRVFRAQTGQSPHAYILRQKMLLACRLLKDGDLPIAEIARQAGFSDPAHFVRRFKGLLHLTPGRFRKIGVVPLW